MIQFRQDAQNKLLELLESWVSVDALTAETGAVKFDKRLYDVPLEETPFVVANVRDFQKVQGGEIGNEHDLYTWDAHIYYIDIDADYDIGEAKRDTILGIIVKNLEEDRRLGNLQTVSGSEREYVYSLDVNTGIFDSSGQEEYFSFTGELHIELFTARG